MCQWYCGRHKRPLEKERPVGIRILEGKQQEPIKNGGRVRRILGYMKRGHRGK